MTLGKSRMKMALLAKNSEIAVTSPVTMATKVGQWPQCFLSPDCHCNICLLRAMELAWPPQWVRRPCLRRVEYHIKSGKELSPLPPAADPVGVRGKTTTFPAFVRIFH